MVCLAQDDNAVRSNPSHFTPNCTQKIGHPQGMHTASQHDGHNNFLATYDKTLISICSMTPRANPKPDACAYLKFTIFGTSLDVTRSMIWDKTTTTCFSVYAVNSLKRLPRLSTPSLMRMRVKRFVDLWSIVAEPCLQPTTWIFYQLHLTSDTRYDANILHVENKIMSIVALWRNE
jgi:hypothetical protein